MSETPIFDQLVAEMHKQGVHYDSLVGWRPKPYVPTIVTSAINAVPAPDVIYINSTEQTKLISVKPLFERSVA